MSDKRQSWIGWLAVLLVPLGLVFGIGYAHFRARRMVAEEVHRHARSACVDAMRDAQAAAAGERLRLCRELLASWRLVDTPELDLAEIGAALPLPLALTRTVRVHNPDALRDETRRSMAEALSTITGLPLVEELTAWEAALGETE